MAVIWKNRKRRQKNCGCYQSLADFAEELTEDTTQIPENLAYYIDCERMSRDMELSGDISPLKRSSKKFTYFGAVKTERVLPALS
ncbi:MAG: antirestriction protein ArdA [Nitrosomonas sp.]|nr:antirestriction protein ArdA [Nitrosomonas sp.]